MSDFDNLRAAFKEWHNRNRAYEISLVKFALRFAEGFREHIGAPEYFVQPDGVIKTQYVEALKLTDDNNLVSSDDLLRRDENDEYFEFGLRIYMEFESDAYPKRPFGYIIGFRRTNEDEYELKIAGRTFKVSDDRSRQDVYRFMVDNLKDAFAQEPWDAVEKMAIGFVQFEK